MLLNDFRVAGIYHIQKAKIEMIFPGFKGRVKTKLMTNVMH